MCREGEEFSNKLLDKVDALFNCPSDFEIFCSDLENGNFSDIGTKRQTEI